MNCPFCSYDKTKVLESRLSCEKTSIRRRRECELCLKRFTTYERVENSSLIVIKKDMTKEKFLREKVLKSMSDACIKLHVSPNLLEKIADCIESEISINGKKEITSNYLGEKVLYYLKDINEIAYLRYLSAFREYRTIDELVNEIKVLSKTPVLI
ncbi:MAG TPA: transcriptional regulator NrdR [Candidatus Gastranaerophilales bacterium]|nr:transcriptional regulator NrdR [Candidatus Gastranaerophilales bacterium]